jgi:hypothetical protein
MKRTCVAILALLSLSSAALAQGWTNAAPVSRQAFAQAVQTALSHDPTGRYVRNANNCGMELQEPIWGPNDVLLGYSCYRNSN